MYICVYVDTYTILWWSHKGHFDMLDYNRSVQRLHALGMPRYRNFYVICHRQRNVSWNSFVFSFVITHHNEQISIIIIKINLCLNADISIHSKASIISTIFHSCSCLLVIYLLKATIRTISSLCHDIKQAILYIVELFVTKCKSQLSWHPWHARTVHTLYFIPNFMFPIAHPHV